MVLQRETSRDGWRGRSPRLWRALMAGGAFVCVIAVAGPATQAAMLDADSCRKIRAEHDTLGASGIREMMAKGPEWGKANLTKERLEQIKRFLSLDEDVRFRCPLGKARPELEAAESEAGAVTALQPGETEGAAKAAAAATTQPAAKPARKTKTSAAPLPPPPAPPSDQGSTPAAAFAPAAAEPSPVKPKSAPAKAKATPPKSATQPAAEATAPAEAAPAETTRKSPR